ncbi:hypothetical protein D9M68_617070 [compost metagenome]
MHIAELRLRERHAREEGAQQHIFPGLGVVADEIGLAQSGADQADGLDRQGLADRVGLLGDIGLDGVGQGIHAGRRGDRRWQLPGHFGVEDRQLGE